MTRLLSKKFVITTLVASALASTLSAASAQTASLNVDTITVGIANNKPWGYRDIDGQVKGVNADITRAVFEGLGVKHVNFAVGDFGSLIPGLISKRFDVVDSGVVITPARCKLVDFGNPDLAIRDALLVAKGNPKKIHSFSDVVKNTAITIGGSRGGQQTKDASLAGVPDERLKQFQNTESTVSALVAGRVDGIVFTTATARTLLEQPGMKDKIEVATPFTGLIDPRTHKEVISYIGPAFNKDAPQLSAAYNRQLAKLTADGTVAKIAAKYGFAAEELVPAGTTSASICSQ